jgi:reactive intermediate/imine deaminase
MLSEKSVPNETITPPDWPASVAPYVQGVRAGRTVYLAGQVALDNENKPVAPGDVAVQTTVVMQRIETLLAQVGGSLTDLVTATVFITDLNDFDRFNRAWADALGEHRCARATVRADLLMPGLVVEVQAVAVLQHDQPPTPCDK